MAEPLPITLSYLLKKFKVCLQGSYTEERCFFLLGQRVFSDFFSKESPARPNEGKKDTVASRLINGTYHTVRNNPYAKMADLFSDPDYAGKARDTIRQKWAESGKPKTLKSIFQEQAEKMACDPAFTQEPGNISLSRLQNRLKQLCPDGSAPADSGNIPDFLTAVTILSLTRGHWENALSFCFGSSSPKPVLHTPLPEENTGIRKQYDLASASYKKREYKETITALKDLPGLLSDNSPLKGAVYYLLSRAQAALSEESGMPEEARKSCRMHASANRKNALKLHCPDALSEEAEKRFDSYKKSLSAHPIPQSGDRELEKICGYCLELVKLEDIRFKGDAYWILYQAASVYGYVLPEGLGQDFCLRQAYQFGQKEAGEEYVRQNTVSLTRSLVPSKSAGAGTCFVNSRNRYSEILRKTLPESWDFVILNPEAAAFDDASFPYDTPTRFFLLDDDFDRNIDSLLSILQAVRNKGNADTEIFIRGAQEKLAPVVDTALAHMGGIVIPVHILDDDKNAARVLAKHPLSCSVARYTCGGSCKFYYIIIGSSACCKWLVREAFWMCTFRNPGIRPHIILIAPDANRLVDELLFSCPGMEQAAVDFPLRNADSIESGYPYIVPLQCSFQSTELIKNIQELLTAGPACFSIDLGSDLDNLSMAVRIREETVRHWVKRPDSGYTIELPVITFKCVSPDIAALGRTSVVLNEKNGGAWYNNYAIIPFGTASEQYSWDALTNSLFEEMSLNMHLQHNDDALSDYYTRTYNRDSSMSAAMSVGYRLCQFRINGQGIIPPRLGSPERGWHLFGKGLGADHIRQIMGGL